MSKNVEITPDELRAIRELGDLDLTMIVSEVNAHGWEVARVLLPVIVRTNTANMENPA